MNTFQEEQREWISLSGGCCHSRVEDRLVGSGTIGKALVKLK